MTRTIDILNGVPHAIALLDSQARILTMNTLFEALTGYDAVDVKGVEADYVIRPSIKSSNFPSILASGQSSSYEGNIIDAGRKKIPIRFTASPLKDDNGQFSTVLVVLENISLLRELDRKIHDGGATGSIIGHSPGMQEIFELLPVLAHTDATVLITGETGTGKDLLAEAIHQASKRAPCPFIKVNCGAIPENLLESELFGHQRGAFTGAHADKPGMFRLAQGGTIYLTEIGDLPIQLQVKLLTVLDDREFYPLGSSKKVGVDVRIITGTHRNLKQLVQEGKFREDLFFRLNVLRAHLPALREREGDIRLLLDHFLQKISGNLKKDIKGFSKAAYTQLKGYQYPGNIRELRNIVEFAVNMSRDSHISPNNLPSYIVAPKEKEVSQDGVPTASSVIASSKENTRGNAIPEPVSSWTEMEKKKILSALLHNNGNRTKAALELNWGRSTLWRKINMYKIG